MANHMANGKVIFQITNDDEYSIREQWLASGDYSDCVFVVGRTEAERQEVRAHRQILMVSGSPKLYDLLCHHQGNDPIMMPDIEPKIFHTLLSAIYLHRFEVPDFVTACIVAKLANEFGLPHIAKTCLNYMRSSDNLNANNVIETFELAEERSAVVDMGECFPTIIPHV